MLAVSSFSFLFERKKKRKRSKRKEKLNPKGDKTVRGEPLKPPRIQMFTFCFFWAFYIKNIIGLYIIFYPTKLT